MNIVSVLFIMVEKQQEQESKEEESCSSYLQKKCKKKTVLNASSKINLYRYSNNVVCRDARNF